MDITVKADGQERFILASTLDEWRDRIDLVEALQGAAPGQDIRGLIVDLDGVTYINSAGLGAIFALRKFAKEKGAILVVSRPSPTVSRMLNTVNLPQLIPVTDTLDAARVALTGQSGQA